ncbi:MFS transporter [Jiangella alba]|uniref:Major Facilitator Superfamily protein n=1 Tax=Jiangella alba TaxID=561176 RepID=A0A1H5PU06_9ACTN|nr:MFS transporter [Jiangella alba]SEF16477.1 Major Facilitator Superfamily protein [Jiangella alba]
MSPLASYRRLLSLAGIGYVVVAFLGRLPLAMSQMGTLLLVSDATGRYAAGGLAAGALAVANAVGAPLAGGIADRVGQRPVVLAQSLTAGVALAALVAAVQSDASIPVLVGAAAVAGFTMPQVGPLARVRWRPITHRTGAAQPRLVDAAFSYEGAADEASFVLGPALVGLGAVALSPSGALLAAAGLLVVFGSWFALHSTARLTHALRASAAAHGTAFVTVAFLTLCLAQLLIGVIFGATQTGTTALATAAGTPGMAGLVHSLLGVGSVLAGLATAALPARFGYDKRILVFATGLVVLSAPLLLAGSLAALVPVVLVLGLAVAPYMISVFAAAERTVPAARVGAAMTLLAGATGIGYAVGSGIAGRLADLGGHRPAFAVTVTAAALAVLLAVVRLRTQRPAGDVTTPDGLAAASQG